MQVFLDFNHKGKIINAVAIYNFNQIEDAVLVKPKKHTEELGDSIFFKFDNNWNSESFIKSHFPATYSNIVQNLVDSLRKEQTSLRKQQILMEVYTQNILS